MESVARLLEDSRRLASFDHRLADLIKQRVYALTLGHENLNDHGELRSRTGAVDSGRSVGGAVESVDAVPSGAARWPGDGGGDSRSVVGAVRGGACEAAALADSGFRRHGYAVARRAGGTVLSCLL